MIARPLKPRILGFTPSGKPSRGPLPGRDLWSSLAFGSSWGAQAAMVLGLVMGTIAASAAPSHGSELLARLAAIPAVSGYEDSLRDALVRELPGWCRPETDAMGSLVVDLGGQGPVHLVAAALDEPGY